MCLLPAPLALSFRSRSRFLVSCDLICREAHLRLIMYLTHLLYPRHYPQAEVFSLAGLSTPRSYTTNLGSSYTTQQRPLSLTTSHLTSGILIKKCLLSSHSLSQNAAPIPAEPSHAQNRHRESTSSPSSHHPTTVLQHPFSKPFSTPSTSSSLVTLTAL